MLSAGLLAALTIPYDVMAAVRHAPAIILPVGIALSLWFNRGRAFLALLSLLLAYVGYAVTGGPDNDAFAARAVLSAAAIFVPLNITLILALPERGVMHFRSHRWLLLIAVECLLCAWIASAGHSPLSGVAWQSVLNHWLLRPDPTPFTGRILFAIQIASLIPF